MHNGPIRIKIPPFDTALEIVLITNVKCITKQQCSSDLWPLSLKRSEIVLLPNNFGFIGFLFFGRIPVDLSHFSLHFDSILSPKAPKYFILNVLK
jgi:hypothetical protein